MEHRVGIPECLPTRVSSNQACRTVPSTEAGIRWRLIAPHSQRMVWVVDTLATNNQTSDATSWRKLSFVVRLQALSSSWLTCGARNTAVEAPPQTTLSCAIRLPISNSKSTICSAHLRTSDRHKQHRPRPRPRGHRRGRHTLTQMSMLVIELPRIRAKTVRVLSCACRLPTSSASCPRCGVLKSNSECDEPQRRTQNYACPSPISSSRSSTCDAHKTSRDLTRRMLSSDAP